MHHYVRDVKLLELHCRDAVNLDRAYHSIGTLGGGNHFIEIDKDEETGDLYLVVHSGSRHLGVEVANYYQEWAYTSLKNGYKNDREYIIDKLREEGRERDIPEELAKIGTFNIPKELCYVGGRLFDSYLHDMRIVQNYANWNRLAIADQIRWDMGWHVEEEFTTVHNYIDTENMILRKGAVSAQAGEKLLIPINMRDGSLICVGKGNPDWNCSAPHGAGRLFGRAAAKKRFSMEEFKDSMSGIYTTSINRDTLDECPMAYKSMEDIVNNIGDTVNILKVIKPVYNFKAGE
jgi:RNA-splicing ligase RtcB